MPVITEVARGKTAAAPEGEGDLPHVLLVVDQFPKTLGGGERIVLRLAALLPRYGYRVSILTFFVDPECLALASAPCPVFLLPITKTYDRTAWRAGVALRRFLLEQKVAIVQTFFESSDLWAGVVAKLTPGVKLVWSRRDMGILRSPKHTVTYRLMRSVPDAVLAVSEQVRRHAIEIDRIPPERVRVMYNGLDLASWEGVAGRSTDGGSSRIVTVGNIRRVKGHDVFVKAAAMVRRRFPDASFSIAGDVLEPDYFAELQAMVRELGLHGHFHFVGGVTELHNYLRDADVFVLPSRSEGFSNAIVEAMAAALPVVATDVGGNAEAVESGVTGWVVPPEDPEALAGAMMRLLGDAETARRMGAAGKRVAAERFTTAAMMEEVTRVYRTLLRDRSL